MKWDTTDPRLTNKLHTSIVAYIILQRLRIPQDQLMMAYTGRNMFWIE
jgi:hypothetical protein